MYSKEESKQLRQDFWIAFGKSFPKKWVLYDTKIKGLVFRFTFSLKKAVVSMDVDCHNLETRIALWEKVISLKSILQDGFLTEMFCEDCYILENGKEISRVFVEFQNVSIHDKNTWREVMIFFNKNMNVFEVFFEEYHDILRG